MGDLFFDYSEIIEELKELEHESDEKYVKIIYQSEPLGEYGIVLELTTFDSEAYEMDQKLRKKKQCEKINIRDFQLNHNLIPDGIIGPQTLLELERCLNERVDEFYKSELIKMKNRIEHKVEV